MKKILFLFIVSAAFMLSGCCKHEWKEATCTEPKTCILCGETEGESLGHSEGEWVTIVEPTCEETGLQTISCIVCNETLYKEDLKAVGHAEGDWETLTEPNCMVEGEAALYCKNCQKELDRKTLPISEHKYSEWVTDKKATCEKDGKQHAVCEVCGEKIEEIIEKTGHEYVAGKCKVCKKYAFKVRDINKEYKDKNGITVSISTIYCFSDSEGNHCKVEFTYKNTTQKEKTSGTYKLIFDDDTYSLDLCAYKLAPGETKSMGLFIPYDDGTVVTLEYVPYGVNTKENDTLYDSDGLFWIDILQIDMKSAVKVALQINKDTGSILSRKQLAKKMEEKGYPLDFAGDVIVNAIFDGKLVFKENCLNYMREACNRLNLSGKDFVAEFKDNRTFNLILKTSGFSDEEIAYAYENIVK